jgi:hypothetical protein
VSDEEHPRQCYAGKRIADLRGPRSPVSLPTPDEATLLPDPRAAHAALLARFRAVNGPKDETEFPNMSARDVRAFANVITFALRNDLPAIDDHDAAVIWEKWRQIVAEVHGHLRNVRDADATASHGLSSARIILEHRGWDIRESLVVSLLRPGAIFNRYCPWRAAWASYDRIYPRPS